MDVDVIEGRVQDVAKAWGRAQMARAMNPGVDRFKALDDEKQYEFRNTLSGYVRLCSLLSQVMPFSDPDMEKLYTFSRFLESKLPKDAKKAALDLEGDVALKYYRLQKLSEGQVMLSLGEGVALRAPTDVGTRKAPDMEAHLSEIIEVLNERFGPSSPRQTSFHSNSSSRRPSRTARSWSARSPTRSTTSSWR